MTISILINVYQKSNLNVFRTYLVGFKSIFVYKVAGTPRVLRQLIGTHLARGASGKSAL
jgi:hypothetical protein